MHTIAVYPANYTEQQLYAMYDSIAAAFPDQDPEDVREAADFACVSPADWATHREECVKEIAAFL